MSCKPIFAIAALAAIAGTIALAQPAKESKPAAKPGAAQPAGQPELPPGVNAADMQACMEAGTPGEQHAWLAQSAGTWHAKSKMWMAPNTEPMASEADTTISAAMDGRYTRIETSCDMPGMGMFTGSGVYGFDNVSQKFVSTWIDNMSTGIMTGTGERSSDGSTLTWTYTYNCPINKKPATLREVQKRSGKDTMTIEMFGKDPHTGVEFKMMEMACTRTAGGHAGAGGH